MFVKIHPAYAIQNQIHSYWLQYINKIFGFIIYDFISTKVQGYFPLFLRANGTIDNSTKNLTDLNSSGPNTTRSTMDQDFLAFFQATSLKYIVPYGVNCFG